MEYCSQLDSLDNHMSDMEQFMRNENKTALNEPIAAIEARTLITICIQVLCWVSTIAVIECFRMGKIFST